MSQSSFLTAREVADRLKLNLLTIYEYIKDGSLQAIKFGRSYRILETDLDEFVTEHRVKNRN